jgi:hypothetical protein
MARDDKGKKRRDRAALRKQTKESNKIERISSKLKEEYKNSPYVKRRSEEENSPEMLSDRYAEGYVDIVKRGIKDSKELRQKLKDFKRINRTTLSEDKKEDRKNKKPVQQESVPQEGATLSNVVGDVSVTDNTQTPPPSSPSVSASSFDFSGMSDEQETAAIENRTKELVAKLKPIYVNRMGGGSADADAERILLNKPIQQLEQEAKQLELGSDIFESKQPSEQLRTLAELPDADKEALAQDKNIATSLMNDAASNPNLTSGEYADAAKEASNIEKEVNKKNTEDVLSLSNQGDNLAQAQTGGEGQTEQTGGTPSAPPVAGTGETLTSIAPPVAGQRPDIINQPNAKVQIGSSIIKGAPNQSLLKQLNAANKISTIEDLDVKDYFPEAGRDIAVGNFTGSRIGSQTIYSGAGVLAPIGLYEARKRAMKNEAQNKIKLINDILQIPDAPKQFQVKYGDAAHDRLMGILSEVDFDVNKLYANPEAIKEINRIKNVATDMHHYDKWAQDLIDAAAPKEGTGSNRYVSKDMLEYARKIKSAMVQDVDKIVNGEQSLQQYFENAGVYLNPYKWADETAKTIFNPNNLSQSPLRLKNVDEAAKEAKTKGEPFDAVAYEKERNDYIASVNDGNKATDTYVTGLVKFFDSDNLRNMVEAAYKGQNFHESTKEDVYKYLLSQAPVQTVLDYKTNGNAYIAEMQEAGKNRRQDKELAQRKEELMTTFDYIEQEGLNSDQNILEQLTGDPAQDEAIIQTALKTGSTGGAVKKGFNGKSWVVEMGIPSSPSTGASKVISSNQTFRMKTADGKALTMTAGQIGNYKGGKLFSYDDGMEITEADKKNFNRFATMPEVRYGIPDKFVIQKNYVDRNTGKRVYLTSENAMNWADSPNKSETSTLLSKAQVRFTNANGEETVIGLPGLYVDETSTIDNRSKSGKTRGNKILYPESPLQKKKETESSSSFFSGREDNE